jgi:hypothetical protein
MPSIGVVVESAFDELFLMTEVNDNKTIEMIAIIVKMKDSLIFLFTMILFNGLSYFLPIIIFIY